MQTLEHPASSAPGSGGDVHHAAMGRPIRICFISPLGYGLYRPESGYPFGGAEVQFFLLANELAADPAFYVTVLTTVREEPGIERYGALTVRRRTGRQRLAQAGASAPALLRQAVASFLDMRALLRDIDADVYLHASAGIEVGAYAVICRLLRRKFFYVIASSADLSDADGHVAGPLRRLFPLGVRLADAVVCRSHEQLDRLRVRYGREGVLIRTGHPVPAAPLRKETVLWVGRMHPLKQPQMFLDLAERLPRERCVMAVMRDDRHGDLRDAVLARAARLPNVTLQEDVAWNAVGGLFAEAKVLVNTSTYEGFPNTFVQAALAMAPVVSLSVDPDGVLAKEGLGVCAAGSFERLVAETGRLCAAEADRSAMGHRAREYARAHHDVARSAEALKALVRAHVQARA